MSKKPLAFTEDTAPAKTLYIFGIPPAGGVDSELKFTIANLFGNTPIQIYTQQTAPAAAANVVKTWAQDYAAGDTRLYFQSESGNPIIVGGNELQIYNTADIAVNYERAYFKWSANAVNIGVEKGGSGTARSLTITGPGTGQTITMSVASNEIAINTNSKNISFDGTNGIFYPYLGGGGIDLGYAGSFWKGLYVGYGANGQGLSFPPPLTELTAVADASTTQLSTIQIPANSIVIGVSGRVTVQPGNTTTMDVGVVGGTARYGDDISTIADTTWTGVIDGTRAYTSAISILYTFNAQTNNGLGRIRTTIHYITITPPTS